MEINKYGIYRIPSEEYHKDPCPLPSLSRSTIRELVFNSPAHAWFHHPRLNPNYKEDDGNGKFDVGTAAHALLLEGLDIVSVIDAEDWRKKETKDKRDAARLEGKVPLLKHQYDEAKAMVDAAIIAIGRCKELGIDSIACDGDAELSYIWKEKEGVWVRTRPDWISKDRKIILDYKTTGATANPQDLARQIVSQGYDIQAALYKRGVVTIEDEDPKFVFLFQEAYEPYLCSFVSLPPDFMEIGKQKVDYGVFLWNECLSSDKWPAYPERVCWLNTPAWLSASWEQRASEIGVGE